MTIHNDTVSCNWEFYVPSWYYVIYQPYREGAAAVFLCVRLSVLVWVCACLCVCTELTHSLLSGYLHLTAPSWCSGPRSSRASAVWLLGTLVVAWQGTVLPGCHGAHLLPLVSRQSSGSVVHLQVGMPCLSQYLYQENYEPCLNPILSGLAVGFPKQSIIWYYISCARLGCTHESLPLLSLMYKLWYQGTNYLANASGRLEKNFEYSSVCTLVNWTEG